MKRVRIFGILSLYVFALLIVRPISVQAAVRDTTSFRIIFDVDSLHIQPEKYNNSVTFSAISECWKAISADTTVTDIEVQIQGNASIEGKDEISLSLARSRALSTYAYLYKYYSIPDSLFTIIEGRHMLLGTNDRIDTLSNSVKAMVDIDTVRTLINQTSSSKLRKTFMQLDTTGATWDWIKEYVLAPTRFSEVSFIYTSNRTSQQVEEVPVAINPADTTVATVQQAKTKKTIFRIKTNLLYDVVTIPSLGAEIGFADHFGFSLLGTFSPWNLKKDLKFRTLLFQPEFRYYLKEGYNGHYFGIDGHFGWYNIAWFNSPTRYQDRDGKTPLWGAGLVYGYVLPFNEHWGMDFSVGAGYAKLDYDCFYNVPDGKKYTSGTKNYWGPTNLGVSLFYKF